MRVWSPVLAVVVACGVVQAQTIKFEPRAGVPTYAAREPVLRVTPGAIVETRTLSDPDDYYTRAGGKWSGEVGPFYIEGATPNDTLVVRILKLRPNRDTAVSQVNPGGLSGDAFRIAHVELIDWLVSDYGFDRMDAYQVVSQVGHARIANVVDPLYTVVAKFPKRFLPPKK